jgi:opacity protein-like surface antigen
MFSKFLWIMLFTMSSIFAESVYVEAVGGKGVQDSERDAILEFIKSSINNHSGYELARDKSSAQIVLTPKLLKLSDTYFLKLSKSVNGKVVNSAQMKSKELSDIDRVTDRLVTSVLKEKSVEDTAQVDNITNDEVNKNTNRFEVTRQWYIGFGPGWLSKSNISKSGFLFKLGHEWGLDPNFAINLSLDSLSVSDSSASFSLFQLGLDYYFSRSKTSPYLGAGIGYGSADSHGCSDSFITYSCSNEEEASGWAASVNGGFKFFRTSTVNLGVEAEYAYLFDETRYGNPSRYTISIAVYY